MLDLCRIIFGIVVDLFRPRAALEAEILVLRQQIIVLRRGRPSRVPFLAVDRMVLGWVCQPFPKTRAAGACNFCQRAQGEKRDRSQRRSLCRSRNSHVQKNRI